MCEGLEWVLAGMGVLGENSRARVRHEEGPHSSQYWPTLAFWETSVELDLCFPNKTNSSLFFSKVNKKYLILANNKSV